MASSITDINQLDFNKQYTYADYLTWQLNERVELIKGWLYKMPASPSFRQESCAKIKTSISISRVIFKPWKIF